MNMNADRNRYFRRLLYISSFVISVIPALFYTAPAFEDGLGTMATAAYLTGHDWSTFLAEDGYYYKYGQSLWYILPFLLIDHAVIRYKVMLVINSALTALIPVAAYDISVRYMAVDQSDALWVSALTGLFPSILLYNKYTWAETNLLLIPWLILLLQEELFTTRDFSVWKKRICSAGIAMLAVYAFMSHQRGLILVIATTITVFCMWICRRKSVSGISYIVALVSGLAADRLISTWQKANVYARAVMEHNTLADFLKPEIYHKLFSLKGMEVVGSTFLGWLYNCVCSTFGLALTSLIVMFMLLWRCMRKGTDGHAGLKDVSDVFALQVLLGFLGAFALGLLFFFQCIYSYFDGTQVERSDHLLFGRYLESSLPLLFYFGMIGMCRRNVNKGIRIVAVSVHAVLFTFVSVRLFPLMKNVNCYVHSLMSMNLFMDTSMVTVTLDTIPNYTQALFAFGILSFVVALLFWFLFPKNKKAACLLIAIVFLWIYLWNSVTVTGRVDRIGDTRYAEYYLQN